MKSLLTYDEIEDIGEYAIANYDKKKHRTNYLCVDIEGFMTEALKLIIQYENIAEDNPGKIAFLSDGIRKLNVKRSNKKMQVLFPKDTVVIDNYYLDPEYSAQLRFHMAHEAAHKLIELHVPVRSTAYFHCELDAGVEIPMDELHEVFSMMELYANRLAAVLLMPKSLVMRTLKKHHKHAESGRHQPLLRIPFQLRCLSQYGDPLPCSPPQGIQASLQGRADRLKPLRQNRPPEERKV